MKAKNVTLADKDGNEVRALLFVCPNPKCGSDLLRIMEIRGHVHLMCGRCNKSFARLSGVHFVPEKPSPI
jgi:hypothetical protein